MMPADRSILDLLKSELGFIESGGYSNLEAPEGKSPVIFRESPTCLFVRQPAAAWPCADCPLLEFVPPAARSGPLPCHAVPVGPDGETVEQAAAGGDRQYLERVVSEWLRSTIQRVERAQKARTTAATRRAHATRKRQILIVEGDDGMAILLKHLLESEGYEVVSATNGQAARRDLGRRPFDLIVLGDYLPDISVEVFLRQAQNLEQPAPVLLTQNGPLPGKMAVKYAELGVHFFISKHNPRQVATLVGDCLKMSRHAGAGAEAAERNRARHFERAP